MKIHLIESNKNKELYSYLKRKYIIVNLDKIKEANVIIVNKVYNIKYALDIVDFALNEGKEIICIKNSFSKEHYVCNYLIKNGATYV